MRPRHLRDLNDQWLIKNHFFGMYQTDPETEEVYLVNPTNKSQRMPKDVVQAGIDAAVSRVEDTLQVSIRKHEHHVEWHDYDIDTFAQYMHINLDHYPVYDVHSVEITFGEHGPQILQVPADMIQIHGEGSLFGTIQVLPFHGIPVTSQYDPAMMPWISGVFAAPRVPSAIKVEYSYGIDGMEPEIDPGILRAIELFAAIHPLNIMGDIIIGAGVASMSTSFDGISMSVNTTASAENSALSARINMYRKELYGELSQPGLLQSLTAKWRRMPLGLM